jgi:hypothetical protein
MSLRKLAATVAFFGCAIILLVVSPALSLKVSLQSILARLIRYSESMPAEKIYVHIDRPVYAAGEDIWFNSYIINASTPTSGPVSEIIYVELQKENGGLIDRKILHVTNGTAGGDFKLPASLANGHYWVRAYTNYLKNFDEAWFFQKAITIQSGEPKKTDAPHRPGKIDLQFFPEGGTFLTGFENRLALKATNANGDDIAVKGIVLDSKKSPVVAFETVHAGMGVMKLIPKPDEAYTAVLVVEGDSTYFPLPVVERVGYNLSITDAGKSFKISAMATGKAMDRDMYLVIQSNGMAHYGARVNFKNGSLKALVRKDLFPSGIAQVTLLDESLLPRCERLVFINHFDSPKISMTVNKEVYQKREKLILKGAVTDSKGDPVAGHFSLSIFDSDKAGDSEEYPATIESTFLLTSDLKGIIHNPGYYFNDTLPDTRHHLDLLMMTHGWRRFKWEDVLKDTLPSLVYPPERGIRIAGKVSQPASKKKKRAGSVKILTPDGGLLMLPIGDAGEFSTDKMLYYDSAELVIETDDEKGQPRDLDLVLHPFTPSPPFAGIAIAANSRDLSAFLFQAGEIKRVNEAIKIEEGTLLEGITITGKKIEEEKKSYVMLPGFKPDIQVPAASLLSGSQNALDALRGRVPGVNISGESNNPVINIRGTAPTLLYDGTRVDAIFLSTVQRTDIDHIDISKDGVYSPNTMGIVAFYSKRFAGTSGITTEGILKKKYPGLSVAREFYSPNYAKTDTRHKYPDFRSTLYWNNDIKPDANGKFEVSFYIADVITRYRAVLEGMSISGKPASGSVTIRMIQ